MLKVADLLPSPLPKVGKLPDRWRRARLDDVANRASGHTPDQGKPQYWNGGIKWVSLADSGQLDRGYIEETDKEISALGVRHSSAVLLPAETVIISRDAGVGKSAVLKDKMAVSQHFIAWDCGPKGQIEPWFLYNWLQVQKPFFERMAVGSTIKTIGLPLFKRLTIDFPPLPEQRKIAEILRTWDEAIEKLEALRAAKLRRHRALTHSLVFGTRQLDRFRTTDEVTAHRWFTLPATWGIKPIGKLAREISERNGDGEQHEVLSCSKYDGFVRSLEYFKKQVFSADLSGYKKIWRGDFGFPSNHVEEGSIGLQNLTDVGVVSPIYTVFRFASERVDADYAFAVLKTGLYRHIFEVSTSASVDRRGSLRWSEFSKLPFPLPPLAEQRAIAEVLRTAHTDLDALSTEIEALTRQKRGLMQKLLTGEWRVKVEAD
jgi:type I restriction enzyme S subunit